MRRWIKATVIGVGVLAAFVATLVGLGSAFHTYRYPYGWSHCCDKGLSLTLYQYTEAHGGWYPRGEVTPEASLSLLYRMEPGIMETLRGKTVPAEVVRERLEAGKLLTPETCGWHYVEGLRKDDDPRLALFWDKVGLAHNGERLPEGAHLVWFVNITNQYIPGDQWQEFLAEQKELWAELKRP